MSTGIGRVSHRYDNVIVTEMKMSYLSEDSSSLEFYAKTRNENKRTATGERNEGISKRTNKRE